MASAVKFCWRAHCLANGWQSCLQFVSAYIGCQSVLTSRGLGAFEDVQPLYFRAGFRIASISQFDLLALVFQLFYT